MFYNDKDLVLIMLQEYFLKLLIGWSLKKLINSRVLCRKKNVGVFHGTHLLFDELITSQHLLGLKLCFMLKPVDTIFIYSHILSRSPGTNGLNT